jgi:hypothetical protein
MSEQAENDGMGKSDSDTIGKFALGVTIFGLGGYFVLSSGLFAGLTNPSQEKPTPDLNPQAKVKEWRQELDQIGQESTNRQKELEDLTSRLARIRLEVQKRQSDLARFSAKESGRRRMASSPLKKFGSLDDLKSFLSQLPEETFNFGTQSGLDGLVYQNVSMGRPFAEDSIFLRRPGIQWAHAVSKAAIDLKAQGLIIRYLQGEVPLKKAQVLQEYLKELFEGVGDSSTGAKIALKESVDNVTSESDVDLLIAFDSEPQRGER